MKKTVVLYYRLPDALLERLRSVCNVRYFPGGVSPDVRPEFDAALQEAEGLIGTGVPKLEINEELLSRAPKLKVFATISVGYDNCDVSALTRHRVLLTHTPGVLTDTTADTIFAVLLATARRVVELGTMVKQRQWTRGIGGDLFGVNVHHKVMGILGMGRIGTAVAQRARGFDMPVIYADLNRNIDAEQRFGAQRMDLDDVLRQADYVCITLQLTKETTGLINEERLALMKPSAILVNGARGPIIDENALADALRNGVIRAAGLDVFSQEPLPLDSPLIDLPNAVLFPHMGSATHETRYAMMECAVENLIGALHGTLRKNIVNTELLMEGSEQ